MISTPSDKPAQEKNQSPSSTGKMGITYAKLQRWLRGLAEAQVTASGSRATFVSDMYFDAAEAIDKLLSENQALKRQLEERSDTASPEKKRPPDTKMAALMDALRDFHWMARRYADGRSSYAPGRFNDHVRKLLEIGFDPIGLAPLYARDGMGRAFDGLSDEDVAAAERDMPKGHTIPLTEDEGRLAAFADLTKEVQKTIADIRLFGKSFEDSSASKDFCIGVENRLRSALLKIKEAR